MKHYSHLWPGVPFALGAAILFGVSTPLSKLMLGTIDPWLLAGILYTAAGLGLLMFKTLLSLTGNPTSEAPLRKSDYLWLAAIILIGGMIAPLMLMFGLALTSASQASLLLNLEGLATMMIAWLVYRENVDRQILIGAFAILCGAVVLTWNDSKLGFDHGGLFIVGACVAWGIDNNLTRKLSSSDPIQIAMIKGLTAGCVNLILAFALGAKLPTIGFIASASLLGFLSIGVSLVFFMLGLRHLGTARTGAYFSLAPFVGAILAVFLLRESVTLQILVAGFFMLVGLWLHLAERHEHDHVHAELEHDHRHSHDEHHAHKHDADSTEPHSHFHRHEQLRHKHIHYPDLHHRHTHSRTT